ncbi:MAG: ribosome small subunit-dependent GTPase A [Bacteroidetes bacterium]|nr:ribosome small subunit-dependent GTPase A [Bacteroidota bacterium]
MKGVVIKSTGSWYQVRKENGTILPCRLKGKFRLSGIKHTNPITVGDEIEYELEPDSGNGVIHKIADRKNYIIRKANNLSKQTHIIASNLDQCMLIVTLAFPKTSLGFIDRFLVTSEAYHIPAILVFNKSDLFIGENAAYLEETINLYRKIGYTCLRTSIINGEGLAQLKELLQNKTTLLSGHSGVGKSSLLNTIEPGLNLKTQAISNYSEKGQHTTTFAEMHPLSFGGNIVDTPGIREFGLVDFEDAEVSHYFKEMQPLITKCKFNNCKHINEPNCAVQAAVASGAINEQRFSSYLSILSKVDIYE